MAKVVNDFKTNKLLGVLTMHLIHFYCYNVFGKKMATKK